MGTAEQDLEEYQQELKRESYREYALERHVDRLLAWGEECDPISYNAVLEVLQNLSDEEKKTFSRLLRDYCKGDPVDICEFILDRTFESCKEKAYEIAEEIIKDEEKYYDDIDEEEFYNWTPRDYR